MRSTARRRAPFTLASRLTPLALTPQSFLCFERSLRDHNDARSSDKPVHFGEVDYGSTRSCEPLPSARIISDLTAACGKFRKASTANASSSGRRAATDTTASSSLPPDRRNRLDQTQNRRSCARTGVGLLSGMNNKAGRHEAPASSNRHRYRSQMASTSLPSSGELLRPPSPGGRRESRLDLVLLVRPPAQGSVA